LIGVLDEIAAEEWNLRRKKNSSMNTRLKRRTSGRHCNNPWNGRCERADIVVYIRFEDEKRAICRTCWTDISKNGHEW
jgi:hypothetical protein